MKRNILIAGGLLAAATGVCAQGKIPAALPSAGQLQRQIERQRLEVNLSDRVSQVERREPDQPYEVSQGGIRLPRDLCENPEAKGCTRKEAHRS